VQDAVLDEHIGVDDTGGVDEDGTVGSDGDLHIFTVHGSQTGVAEGSAVADRALDNVVLQDVGQLIVRNVSGTAGDSLEGVVVGAKDCDVGQIFKRWHKVDFGGCSGKSGEIAGDERFTNTQWDEQQLVNDVNDAVIEWDVL